MSEAKKTQPVIIEVEHTEGDNSISFALHGSAEWLDKTLSIVMFTLGQITGMVWETADEAAREEMVAGVNALREFQSFEGKLVKVSIAQERRAS